MKTKMILKLINNERINRKIDSAKACDISSQDVCALENYDFAQCTVSSYDLCVKDLAGCTNNTVDYCGGSDGWDYTADCIKTDYK